MQQMKYQFLVQIVAVLFYASTTFAQSPIPRQRDSWPTSNYCGE